MEGYFKVERDDPASKAYRITGITLPVDGKEVAKPFVIKIYLVKLGEALFLDVIVPPDDWDRDKNPKHHIYIIEIKKDELALRVLDEDFVKAQFGVAPPRGNDQTGGDQAGQGDGNDSGTA